MPPSGTKNARSPVARQHNDRRKLQPSQFRLPRCHTLSANSAVRRNSRRKAAPSRLLRDQRNDRRKLQPSQFRLPRCRNRRDDRAMMTQECAGRRELMFTSFPAHSKSARTRARRTLFAKTTPIKKRRRTGRTVRVEPEPASALLKS